MIQGDKPGEEDFVAVLLLQHEEEEDSTDCVIRSYEVEDIQQY
jgi:hypothetical protein